MRRVRTVGLLAFALTVLALSGSATVYVPGEHRSDGYYIRPHFRPSPDLHEDGAEAPAPVAPETRRGDEKEADPLGQEAPRSGTTSPSGR